MNRFQSRTVPHILITGATGYIGSQLAPLLKERGHGVDTLDLRRLKVRTPGRDTNGESELDLDAGDTLPAYDALVHLAGMSGTGEGCGEDELMRSNADLTARVAGLASRFGVPRLVFASSVLAMVDHSSDIVLSDDVSPRPSTPYGRSKLEAEKHVAGFAAENRLAVSLRIPAVLGRYPKGNWRLLMRLAKSGIPLPVASIGNQRSYVSVATLCDAVEAIVDIPLSVRASGSYLLADDGYLSLRDVLGCMRNGMGLANRFFPVPRTAMIRGLNMMGRRREAQSLFGDLRVDASRFCDRFAMVPEADLKALIERQAADFVREST